MYIRHRVQTWWLNQFLWSSILFSAGSFGISRRYDTENNIPLGAAVLNGTGRHITRYEWQHMSPCTTGKEYRHFLRTFQVVSGDIFALGAKKSTILDRTRHCFGLLRAQFWFKMGFYTPKIQPWQCRFGTGSKHGDWTNPWGARHFLVRVVMDFEGGPCGGILIFLTIHV